MKWRQYSNEKKISVLFSDHCEPISHRVYVKPFNGLWFLLLLLKISAFLDSFGTCRFKQFIKFFWNPIKLSFVWGYLLCCQTFLARRLITIRCVIECCYLMRIFCLEILTYLLRLKAFVKEIITLSITFHFNILKAEQFTVNTFYLVFNFNI